MDGEVHQCEGEHAVAVQVTAKANKPSKKQPCLQPRPTLEDSARAHVKTQTTMCDEDHVGAETPIATVALVGLDSKLVIRELPVFEELELHTSRNSHDARHTQQAGAK